MSVVSHAPRLRHLALGCTGKPFDRFRPTKQPFSVLKPPRLSSTRPVAHDSAPLVRYAEPPVLPDRIRRIVQRLSRLPGVGEKTALRYAMFLVTAEEAVSRELGEELLTLHDHIRPCSRCGAIAEVRADEPLLCPICLDSKRDSSLLCVVARVQDMLAIERSKAMRGRYMVLGRLLSPLDGVGPGDLPIGELRRRIRAEGVAEVIVATPPSVDGEATALYLARELADAGVRITRLASGVPHGGDLEFADQITLGRAIDGRRKLES